MSGLRPIPVPRRDPRSPVNCWTDVLNRAVKARGQARCYRVGNSDLYVNLLHRYPRGDSWGDNTFRASVFLGNPRKDRDTRPPIVAEMKIPRNGGSATLSWLATSKVGRKVVSFGDQALPGSVLERMVLAVHAAEGSC